jgi:flavin reductase (DIM6/NTAB) family NADH-FMN oxidoreductase RutF
MSAIDPEALRTAFGSFVTGVTVVTARDGDGRPVGFTANSFSSVSLDPPLLLVCPGRSMSSFRVFESCGRFAVNILAEGQEDVSNTFAGYRGDRFARVDWFAHATGCPLIQGAAAHFCCRTWKVIPAGDHVILVGEIDSFGASGARGLGYASGHYFSLGLEREAAAAPRPGRRAVAGAIVEHDGRILLEGTPLGARPPQVGLNERARVRSVLADHFARAGLDVSLGKAYSVFDDGESDTHYIYFLAEAADDSTGGLGQYVPIEDAVSTPCISRAHSSMLGRFAFERATRSFGLYVGDDALGDIHHFNE